MIRLVIFGSRNAYPGIGEIDAAVRAMGLWYVCHDEPTVGEVICGTANGADLDGRRWAKSWCINVRDFPADWTRHDKRAGLIRNRAMAEYATHGLGFWRGESNGTANMCTHLVALGKPVRIVEWKP